MAVYKCQVRSTDLNQVWAVAQATGTVDFFRIFSSVKVKVKRNKNVFLFPNT